MTMSPRPRSLQPRRGQDGLGVISVMLILVVLGTLAAAIVRIASATSAGQAQDILSSRAWLAARAGNEWGLYQAYKGSWTACANASQTLDLRADTGFLVTVTCNSQSYQEGADGNGNPQTVRLYTLEATACNGASACPDNSRAVQPGYVERRRLVQAQQ